MRFLKRLYMGAILFFLYAPLVMIMAFSFSSGKSRANWGHFTLDWYVQLFRSPDIMQALYYTVLVAVVSAVIATCVGTFAAVGIYGMRPKVRMTILNISYLPVINPDIVTGVSLMMLFIFMKMNLGLGTMLLAHIAFNIPYVIFSVLPKLRQMDESTYEAALDLGARPLQAFFKVVVPQILPGIITGAILAFTLSIDDFVISFFTTRSIENLSIYIYSAARRGVDPSLYALMSLMFVTILSLMLIANWRSLNDKNIRKKIDRRI